MHLRFFISTYILSVIFIYSESGLAQSSEINSDTLPKNHFQNFFLLNGDDVFIEKYDTTLNGFQIDNIILKKSFSNLYIGNLGLAVFSNYTATDRLPLKLNYGINQFKPYEFGIGPEFIKNKNIFTSLNYSRGTKKEQYFIVKHKQKISANAFAGLDFAIAASQGFYARQLTGIRNFDLFGMYETKNERYRLYGKFIYNKISAQENGGLKSDSALSGVSGADARTLPVWLNDADVLHKENAFYFQQELYLIKPQIVASDSMYNINPRNYNLSLVHSFLFNNKAMNFKTATIHDDYFNAIYYDSTATSDSTLTRNYFNDLGFNFSVANLISTGHFLDGDIFAGATHQSFKINQRDLDTIFNDWSIYAGIHLKLMEMCSLLVKYNKSVSSTIEGGRKFESKITYVAFNDFLLLGIGYSNENKIPELFSQVNRSNHFLWTNAFRNINYSRLDFTFDLPWFNLRSGFTSMAVKNHVFYNFDGMPDQYDGTFKYTSMHVSQQVNYKKFHLLNKILWQHTTGKQWVRFPGFITYHSLFYDMSFFKKVLLTQVGIDLRYHSSFYAPYYQPATGQFNLQSEKPYGDYLFADVFINFKVKSARFFAKMEHLNKGWSKKNYMVLAHYPMQGRMLKFGITWNLFD